MEKAIVDALNFKRIIPAGLVEQSISTVIDKTLSFQETEYHKELFNFIKEKLKKKAILLYCSNDMKCYLEQNNQSFIYIDEAVSGAVIANMDDIKDNGLYLLAVTTNPKLGMRGLDYRAPLNGIALIVAASFEN